MSGTIGDHGMNGTGVGSKTTAVNEIANAVGQQKILNVVSFLTEFISETKLSKEYLDFGESQGHWFATIAWVKKHFNQKLKETKAPLVKKFLNKMLNMFPCAKINFYEHLSYDLWFSAQNKDPIAASKGILTSFFENAKKENSKLYNAYKNYFIEFQPDVKPKKCV